MPYATTFGGMYHRAGAAGSVQAAAAVDRRKGGARPGDAVQFRQHVRHHGRQLRQSDGESEGRGRRHHLRRQHREPAADVPVYARSRRAPCTWPRRGSSRRCASYIRRRDCSRRSASRGRQNSSQALLHGDVRALRLVLRRGARCGRRSGCECPSGTRPANCGSDRWSRPTTCGRAAASRFRKEAAGCAARPCSVFSSISALLHLHGQNSILQLRPAGRKRRHRRRQSDVPAQRPDLHHQFVALLEQPDLALDGERQLQPHFVMAVALGERVRRLGAGDGGGILLLAVQRRARAPPAARGPAPRG